MWAVRGMTKGRALMTEAVNQGAQPGPSPLRIVRVMIAVQYLSNYIRFTIVM
jgi:hypothetical protein